MYSVFAFLPCCSSKPCQNCNQIKSTATTTICQETNNLQSVWTRAENDVQRARAEAELCITQQTLMNFQTGASQSNCPLSTKHLSALQGNEWYGSRSINLHTSSLAFLWIIRLLRHSFDASLTRPLILNESIWTDVTAEDGQKHHTRTPPLLSLCSLQCPPCFLLVCFDLVNVLVRCQNVFCVPCSAILFE